MLRFGGIVWHCAGDLWPWQGPLVQGGDGWLLSTEEGHRDSGDVSFSLCSEGEEEMGCKLEGGLREILEHGPVVTR